MASHQQDPAKSRKPFELPTYEHPAYAQHKPEDFTPPPSYHSSAASMVLESETQSPAPPAAPTPRTCAHCAHCHPPSQSSFSTLFSTLFHTLCFTALPAADIIYLYLKLEAAFHPTWFCSLHPFADKIVDNDGIFLFFNLWAFVGISVMYLSSTREGGFMRTTGRWVSAQLLLTGLGLGAVMLQHCLWNSRFTCRGYVPEELRARWEWQRSLHP